MNKQEAENFIYCSYLKAQKNQRYDTPDSLKRHPEYTRALIQAKSSTPSVVVTGSKGKGSVCSMISCILQTKLNVGLMTSPHITDFCERFRINGKKISDEDFISYISSIQGELVSLDRKIPEDTYISPTGIQTLLALNWFHDSHTDFNILECGKGAHYDDVNNVRHDYAIINTIFLEHTRELGSTLKEIAEDKSHVITRKLKAVYTASQAPEVMKILQQRADRFRIPLKIYGIDFSADHIRYSKEGMICDIRIGDIVYPDLLLPLLGEHQSRNLALAMCLCQDLLGSLNEDTLRRCLKEYRWPGRMEILSSDPFIMLDACINPVSCTNVKKVMKQLMIKKAEIIIGIPDDKDYLGVILEMKDMAHQIILTKSENPHYLFTEKQQEEALKTGIQTIRTASVQEAIEVAEESGLPIIILGTTSVVSDVIRVM